MHALISNNLLQDMDLQAILEDLLRLIKLSNITANGMGRTASATTDSSVHEMINCQFSSRSRSL